MQLYIIRHGQSSNNALADFTQRTFDPWLTPLGQQQAEAVARHLASGRNLEQTVGVSEEETGVKTEEGYHLTHLYCSAMYRALQTARPIGQAVGLNPEVWVDIHEGGGIYLDYQDGRPTQGFPGKTRPEILAEFPNYVLPAAVTDHGWWPVQNGQEDWAGCQGRAIRVADQLHRMAKTEPEARVGLVTHGGFSDALLKAILSALPSHQVFFHFFNTAISRVDIRADGHVEVRYINRVGHLSPEMVS